MFNCFVFRDSYHACWDPIQFWPSSCSVVAYSLGKQPWSHSRRTKKSLSTGWIKLSPVRRHQEKLLLACSYSYSQEVEIFWCLLQLRGSNIFLLAPVLLHGIVLEGTTKVTEWLDHSLFVFCCHLFNMSFKMQRKKCEIGGEPIGVQPKLRVKEVGANKPAARWRVHGAGTQGLGQHSWLCCLPGVIPFSSLFPVYLLWS